MILCQSLSFNPRLPKPIFADEVKEVELRLGPSHLESRSVVCDSCFLCGLVSAEPNHASMFFGVSDLRSVFSPMAFSSLL